MRRMRLAGGLVLLLVAMLLVVIGRTQPQAAAAAGPDGIGFYNYHDATFHLRRNATVPGGSDFAYKFGPVGANIQPLAGDWNGDGKDGIGYYNPADGTVHLRNDATRTGPSDYAYVLTKTPNAHVIVGDWNGDGKDGIGYWIFYQHQGVNGDALVYLRDDATRTGLLPYSFLMPFEGIGDPRLLAGDWTGTGRDGLADAEVDCACSVGTGFAQLYLDLDARNGFQAAYQVPLQPPGYDSLPFAGDWNGDGKDGIGYFDRFDNTVHLRNTATTAGSSDYAYRFATGVSELKVLSGRW